MNYNMECPTKFKPGDTVYTVRDVLVQDVCEDCMGTGRLSAAEECPRCEGNGYIEQIIKRPIKNSAVIYEIRYVIGTDSAYFSYSVKNDDRLISRSERELFADYESAVAYCKEQNCIKTIPISDIIIPPKFTETYPSAKKIAKRMEELNAHGKFTNIIEVNENNVLVDGYTTYVLAKGLGHTEVEVIKRKKTWKNHEATL